MKKIDEVFDMLAKLAGEKDGGVCAMEIAEKMGMDRANISRYLNELCKNGKIDKLNGRPVLYKPKEKNKAAPFRRLNDRHCNIISLDRLIGADMSLKAAVQLAKAAVLYPPGGLPVMVLGETGAGKSMFAEAMYGFARESGVIQDDAPFISFNCADYADNPQLLVAQLFGVRRGAYTGAEDDRVGLLKKADGGIIFLDEIHRLPPQGQELLFTYMDKGYFRPLGETEKTVKVNVRIIAATTEEPQSYLLKTFIRRIPVIINLPPLRERSLAERCGLICYFLREESGRINRDIYIDRNCFISYLLYDCAGNVGQLKSDIQIACARAFLSYKSQNREYLMISSEHLPTHVKRGVMKVHNYREEIEKLINNNEDMLYFSSDEDFDIISSESSEDEYFYDVIEKKLDILSKSGMDEKEVNRILNGEIEKHFKRYIQNMPGKYRKDEISKIVGEKVVNVTENILNLAEKKLNRYMDEKIFFGLALHLQKTIGRIESGGKIYNPRINFIRKNYADEFIAAVEAAKLIDIEFGVETPLDEIGYLAMFFVPDSRIEEDKPEGKVGVLVVMHGNSTASSMAQVANDIVGVKHAMGLDMPLSMSPEEMYKTIKECALKIDEGKGVLLLVDMGSLKNFGDMISEETNLKIKTVDMVTTLMVIDACHKAVMGKDLEEIYESALKINAKNPYTIRRDEKRVENIIVTACFTGQGAAKELKRILAEEYLVKKDCIKIIPLEFIDKNQFNKIIERYRENYNLVAVVGTLDFSVPGIPYIPAVDLLTGKAKDFVLNLIDEIDTYEKIEVSLGEHIKAVDGKKCVRMSKSVVEGIQRALGLKIPSDVKVGIILHICFLVEKLALGGEENIFEGIDDYQREHESELKVIKNNVKSIEEYFNIDIGLHECAYLCRMFLENTLEAV
ncbi:sigma 54-interacting transcriptional regulator [Thermoanaerobacterium sp. DL9XJH110]|uniref:sigma 54-interacting transcriptional regulator n=1 Tax=Thermoanaerobacterium sp. DL9XJH110 TaxID=3386643 RepID=UPI003BB6BBD3